MVKRRSFAPPALRDDGADEYAALVTAWWGGGYAATDTNVQ
jgi:hypothetical protein